MMMVSRLVRRVVLLLVVATVPISLRLFLQLLLLLLHGPVNDYFVCSLKFSPSLKIVIE